ncbi:MAG: hypothetical protein LBL75_01060 [Rickettsiales bacterium]|nr:hypothetical protein [Rickettsiales bacterium]
MPTQQEIIIQNLRESDIRLNKSIQFTSKYIFDNLSFNSGLADKKDVIKLIDMHKVIRNRHNDFVKTMTKLGTENLLKKNSEDEIHNIINKRETLNTNIELLKLCANKVSDLGLPGNVFNVFHNELNELTAAKNKVVKNWYR